MAMDLYQIYLFDSQNREIRALSRSNSFEIYSGRRYVDGFFYPVSWTTSKKRSFIESVIEKAETKRLLKEARRSGPREFRQALVSLPEGWDFKLTDSNGRILSGNQFSKAKGFKLYSKNEKTGRFKLDSEWSFSPKSTKQEKIEQIKQASLDVQMETELPLTLPDEIDYLPEIDEGEDIKEVFEETPLPPYFVEEIESDEFMAFTTTPSFSRYTNIIFTDAYPISLLFGEMNDLQKDQLNSIFDKEWKKVWDTTSNSERLYNMRINLNYYDNQGDLMIRPGSEDAPEPLTTYISTIRNRISTKGQGFILFDDMIEQIEAVFDNYLASVNGATGVIASFTIESLFFT
jgi:hypothetical protein